jgi:signal transduction histidine kinase
VSMRERAAALGAEFDIRTQPGTGTAVEVTL